MILDIILPVYTIILLGKLLKQIKLINHAFITTSYKILDNYLLPLLVFWTIAQPIQLNNDSFIFFIVLTLSCALTYVLIYLYILISKVHKNDAALLSQGSCRFNVFICLAVTYGYDKPVLRDICLFIGFGLPTIDFLTYILFNRTTHHVFTINELIKLIFNRNILSPILLSTVFGVIVSTINIEWPLFLSRFFNFVIPATVPLALILIGGRLSFEYLRKPNLLPMMSSIFKFLVLPVIGLICICLFSGDALTAKIIMIILVVPCSVSLSSKSESIINQIYEYNSISTMLSLVFLSAIAIFM